MLNLFNAQERTVKHLTELLQGTGWRLTQVIRNMSDGFLQPVHAVPIFWFSTALIMCCHYACYAQMDYSCVLHDADFEAMFLPNNYQCVRNYENTLRWLFDVVIVSKFMCVYFSGYACQLEGFPGIWRGYITTHIFWRSSRMPIADGTCSAARSGSGVVHRRENLSVTGKTSSEFCRQRNIQLPIRRLPLRGRLSSLPFCAPHSRKPKSISINLLTVL